MWYLTDLIADWMDEGFSYAYISERLCNNKFYKILSEVSMFFK